MFNILNPLESADGSRPTIGVSRREIGPVGTGLYSVYCQKYIIYLLPTKLEQLKEHFQRDFKDFEWVE